MKYMVVGIIYPPLGNQSEVAYGHTPTSFGFDSSPSASSDFGVRWRSIVRAADGLQEAATLGPTELEAGMWGPPAQVTTASAALAQPSSASVTALPGDVDLPSHAYDQFFIWINPALTVTTDYAGQKAVNWSGSANCPSPGNCDGVWIFVFLAGWLDGSLPPPGSPDLQAMLAAFDPDDRVAILKHDPFFDPSGRDPATIATDPRFLELGEALLSANVVMTPAVTWKPCSGTLTDDGFQPLAETDLPFGADETLMLQHSFIATSAACAPQQPGLMLGTTTPNCSLSADVLLDRLYGTLLMVPTYVGASCSGP